ncbi:MAG: hypothetical protein ACK4VN_02580 [Bacteroidales bacterium]
MPPKKPKKLKYRIEYSNGDVEIMECDTFREALDKFSKKAMELKLSVSYELVS